MMAQKLRSLLSASLSSAGGAGDFAQFEKDVKAQEAPRDDDLFKTSMDLAFRRHLTEQVLSGEDPSPADLSACRVLVSYAVGCARADLCAPALPIVLLADAFDLLTLSGCQDLFGCVEDNVGAWKEPLFFAPVKNHLLRICNDLLRRLSRSQNTVFCGRILVFLAKFFPVSERSGLNIISEFNLDNTTVFASQDEADAAAADAAMETDDGEAAAAAAKKKNGVLIEDDEKNLNVDYALYKKFWQLQDFFRSPTQCYERLQWKTFTTYAKDVLNTFESFKLDTVAAGKKDNAASMEADGAEEEEEKYFAKYLTNQNLLQLQLSDSNFRRYVLLQFLILFQYLQSTVKFKSDGEVLSDEQKRWVSANTDRIYKLIRETPPNGAEFADSVKSILKREQQWNAWKNEGCPKFTRAQDARDKAAKAAEANKDEKYTIKTGSRKRRRPVGDQIRDAMAQKKFLMGNMNLSKLWNLCPDNMEACSAPERDFLPSMEDYFEVAIEELNPDNQVEKEYRKVNDGAWGWRALRLMARRYPHFFTFGNHPIARLPDYLEQMLKKMSKNSFGGLNSSNDKSSSSQGGGASSGPAQPKKLTPEVLEKLASLVSDKWKELIPKLGLGADAKEKVEKDKKEEKDRALLLLQTWMEAEGEAATSDELAFVLERCGMASVAQEAGIAAAPDAEDGAATEVASEAAPEVAKEVTKTAEAATA